MESIASRWQSVVLAVIAGTLLAGCSYSGIRGYTIARGKLLAPGSRVVASPVEALARHGAACPSEDTACEYVTVALLLRPVARTASPAQRCAQRTLLDVQVTTREPQQAPAAVSRCGWATAKDMDHLNDTLMVELACPLGTFDEGTKQHVAFYTPGPDGEAKIAGHIELLPYKVLSGAWAYMGAMIFAFVGFGVLI